MADPGKNRPVRGSTLIAAAIVAGALILSWGSSGSQPRYQLAASGNAVVRLDTDSGALLACDLQQCRQVEAPLRAKTWGPVGVVIGNARKEVEQREQQPQKQLPPPSK